MVDTDAPPADTKKTRIILSLDGGGIRGVLICKVLMYLQNQLKKTATSKKARHLPLCDWFDMIAGTSTGAIIGAAMNLEDDVTGQPMYTAGTLLDFYLRLVGDMFTPPAKKSFEEKAIASVTSLIQGTVDRSKPADEALFLHFSKLKLSGCRRKTLIPSYELVAHHPYLFRSWQAKQDRNRDFLMDQVVRAATAAPMLFTPAKLPRAWVRSKMLFNEKSFLERAFPSKRQDIIHAFTLDTLEERQALDAMLALPKQDKAEMYRSTRDKYSSEEWKTTLPDILMKDLLGVLKEEDHTYYTEDDERVYSDHEASGKHMEFLTCMDGAMYANNPAMLAYSEALEVFGSDNLIIVSIGTGRTEPIDFATAKDMKKEDWVKPVMNILREGVQDSISAQLETLARSKVKTNEIKFIRINMELDRKTGEKFGQAPSTDLTATDEENKKRLSRYGDKMVADNKDRLDELVELMVSTQPGCTRD